MIRALYQSTAPPRNQENITKKAKKRHRENSPLIFQRHDLAVKIMRRCHSATKKSYKLDNPFCFLHSSSLISLSSRLQHSINYKESTLERYTY